MIYIYEEHGRIDQAINGKIIIIADAHFPKKRKGKHNDLHSAVSNFLNSADRYSCITHGRPCALDTHMKEGHLSRGQIFNPMVALVEVNLDIGISEVVSLSMPIAVTLRTTKSVVLTFGPNFWDHESFGLQRYPIWSSR